ncbi:hypothetical protein Tco_0539607 [Tanacetum coccineum]
MELKLENREQEQNPKGVGYNVVPPPPTGLFTPPTIDLSNSGLKEFQEHEFEGYGFKANKGVCENSSNEVKKSPDALIIEDWVSDYDEDESEKFYSNSSFNQVWNSTNARQSSSRAAVLVSAARPINTAAPKPFVNVAKTRTNAFQKSHSLSRRPFYQQTTLKNINLNDRVNTAKVNSINTAKGSRVTSAIREQRINAVKSSAYWVWRPKIKVLDHISKNSGSYSCLELQGYLNNDGYADLVRMLVTLLILLMFHMIGLYHITNGHQFTMSNRQERIGYSRANGNW